MEFRILGPLEVVHEDRPLPLGGMKLRGLLAMLLLHANEVVSVDRLIGALWGEPPPATAVASLQNRVSELRKLLGREALATHPPGYLLRVEPGQLDLELFERLRAEARGADPEQAASKLREALALWRGPALADLALEPFAQAEVPRLEELRLFALEERVEAELALGREADVVPEIEGLVAEHPLRERLRAQLMLGLYRAGRQAEALEVYQQGRHFFAAELGLEPGSALKDLERRILTHDRGLDLAATTEASRAERKTVTVLHCELRTFGEELDLETLWRLLHRAFDELQAVLERHGGSVERVLGDTLLATFGIPAVSEDDALRAVRAAAELSTCLAALSEDPEQLYGVRLEASTAVCTGEILAEGRRILLGPVVGAAARLARAGEIVLDRATHRLVADAVTVEQLGGALRLREVAAQAPGWAQRLKAPMIGRERERRLLREAFERVQAEGSPRLVTVLGPPGAGKTRLAEDFLASLPREAVALRGRCLSYGAAVTYWPVVEMLDEAAGLGEEELRRRALSLLDGCTTGKEEIAWGVRSLLDALSRRCPIVLAFDDVHWGEPTFLDLIEHVVEQPGGARILVLCLARPELLDKRPGWKSERIVLTPLSDGECALLVANLLGTAAVPEAATVRIVATAEGNPLYVEELLSMLIDDGRLRRQNGGWAAVGDVATMAVPTTLRALLAARLELLAPEERELLWRASVEGTVFHRGALDELAPWHERERVGSSLESLMDRDLICPAGAQVGGHEGYRFRHQLIREAAYGTVPKETRADLHERLADWLERAGVYEEVVANHLEQAYRYRVELGERAVALAERAADGLAVAGRRAWARGDAPASVSFFTRAVALLPPDAPSRRSLLPELGRALVDIGEFEPAERLLAEADAAGDAPAAARALLPLLDARIRTDPSFGLELARGELEQAIRTLEAAGDDRSLAAAWLTMSYLHLVRYRASDLQSALERGLFHSRQAGAGREEAEMLVFLCAVGWWGPAPVADGIRRCEEVLAQARGRPAITAAALQSLSVLHATAGRFEEARRLIGRARSIRAKLGHAVGAAASAIDEGMIESLAGDWEATERVLRQGYDTLNRLGEKGYLSTVAFMLADNLCAQGRHAEADELARASELAAASDDVVSQVGWRLSRARVLTGRAALAEAERLVRDALALVQETDLVSLRADALATLAGILARAERHDEAVPLLEEAQRLCEAKGSVVLAGRVRAQLDQVAGAALARR